MRTSTGLGRIGRLAIRALQRHPELQLVHVNDVVGDALTHAQRFIALGYASLSQ